MALLEVEDVVVRFGGITAVNHANLSVAAGEITGLIGPNGAGKTTLFNVITGLQTPTSGSVRFDGRDITKLAPQARAHQGIARTFQRLEVFGSLTVHENLMVAAEIRATWDRHAPSPSAVAGELIDVIGLREWATTPSDSVPTGIARLTELGRALAIQPRLLLLDEPSSGLSEDETGDFARLLRRLAHGGQAVMIVEHDVELVMDICSTIHVLDFGEVIASGPPAEIRADKAVQAAYLGVQVDADHEPGAVPA